MLEAETRPVVWRKLPLTSTERIFSAVRSVGRFFTRAQQLPGPATFSEALETYGLPSVPDTTPEQELVFLLRYAAEVEHGLMVQYLYSCYSCSSTEIYPLLQTIAIEEMGHLFTVLNILVGCGADAHLARYDWNPDRKFEPFPFSLEPVSLLALAKYAAAEMPDADDIDSEDRETWEQVLNQLHTNLPGQEFFRVGLLYAKIYWLLRIDDNKLQEPEKEPWPGFPVEKVARQFPRRHVGSYPQGNAAQSHVRPEHWRRGAPTLLTESATSRDEACKAVVNVSAQGEGFAAFQSTEGGHFDRFLSCYSIALSAGKIAHPVPTDPVYGSSSPSSEASLIDSADGLRFARLADDFYELVLVTIGAYFQNARSSNSPQLPTLAGASLDAMAQGMVILAKELRRIERRPGGDSAAHAAAICFSRPALDIPSDVPILQARIDAVSARALQESRSLETAATSPSRQQVAGSITILIEDIRSALQLPI